MSKSGKNLIGNFGIPTNAQVVLRENKVTLGIGYVGKKRENEKYSKETFLRIYRGYDMLENLMLVRSYIQKKHNVDLKFLELLLHLAPKHFFTQEDFKLMAKPFKYSRIGNIVDTGYVKIISKGENISKNLYGLSNIGKRLITEFYELLSGEKQIPIKPSVNPMAKPDANAYDKKKMEMIKKLASLPISVHKKSLF